MSILPYQLRALKRRRQAALAVFGIAAPVPAPVPAPMPCPEAATMRAGIRHIASGRMTELHEELNAVSAMLTARAARGRGPLQHPGLEAILVDGRKQAFAGFWS